MSLEAGHPCGHPRIYKLSREPTLVYVSCSPVACQRFHSNRIPSGQQSGYTNPMGSATTTYSERRVLYRKWEDVPGKGLHQHLQLVLPQEIVPTNLEALHNHSTAGHLGITKTLHKVRSSFYWPGQRRDIEDWCRACEDCASRKQPPKPHRAPLKLDQPGVPMQRVAMDILGPLAETERGSKYVLVIAEYFTKWTEAFPMPNMEAHTVANLLVYHFICRFGAPDYLHTDQGRNFESSLMTGICKLLGYRRPNEPIPSSM